MNGNLVRIVAVVTGVVISVSSGYVASIMGRGERLVRLETKVEYIEGAVGQINVKLDRLVESLL